jgi:cysteine sulfinate desulfinase/cysteine desulfurase-like protein
MGIDDSTGRGVVRISLCCGSTKDCYKHIEENLSKIYEKLSKVMY